MNESKAIMVSGRMWNLDITDDEPRIRDVDLAARAGLKKPRDIRTTIADLRTELESFGPLDVRRDCRRTSMPRGGYRTTETDEYWLTEHQALAVLLQLRTPAARRVRAVVVRVFRAYTRGELRLAAAPASAPTTATRIGDSAPHCEDLDRRCREAARSHRMSLQRVHGRVRQSLNAPGVYRITLENYERVCEVIDSLGDQPSPELPPPPRRRSRKLLPSPQCSLPFPETIQ